MCENENNLVTVNLKGAAILHSHVSTAAQNRQEDDKICGYFFHGHNPVMIWYVYSEVMWKKCP